MPERISKVLGASQKALAKEGVFDGFFRFDSQFHLDPALLRATAAKELKQSAKRLEDYFSDILRLLDNAPDQRGPLWTEAVRRLKVTELNVAALGYSADGAAGRAIGYDTAENLANTAWQIIRAGVKDPVIFELVGLLQKNVGADLISDLTLGIILPDIVAFNARVIEKLGLHSTQARLLDEKVTLPCIRDAEEPILLIPEDILSPLPVAYSWDEIDIVAGYNQEVRQHINSVIGQTWKQATSRRVTKEDLRRVLLQNPTILKDLVRQYKGKPLVPYNFKDDPLGEIVWQEAAKSYATDFPLSLAITDPNDCEVVRQTVVKICEHFRNLIESNGLFKLLYDQQEGLKPERAAQLLFFGISDSYCKANHLDLSPECNSGRGPVDFKFSSGYACRLNVEVKYSSNTKLVSGFTKQLPIYDAAEKSFQSIYLVLRTERSERGVKRLQKLRNDALSNGQRSPDIVLVDARFQPSASHA
jgi:hypothetical protein